MHAVRSIPRRRGAHVTTLLVCMALTAHASTASAQPPTPTLRSLTATGRVVNFTWDRAADLRTTYRADAGSAPGLSDLAQGVVLMGFEGGWVTDVPPGTYFVRVRAELLGEISAPSNEMSVTVDRCPSPVPSTLSGESVGQTAVVQWTFGQNPVGCYATALRLEAGTAPGLANLLSMDVPDFNITQRTFNSVPFGTYYVRAQVFHPGFGWVPTNEVALTFSCLAPPALSNLRATTVGNAARLAWDVGFVRTSDYQLVLEAGTQAGAADIGAVPVVASSNGGFNVAGAAGRYYTRLRATNSCGATVSNELPLTLTDECIAPAPLSFVDASMISGANTVNVQWSPADTGGLVLRYEMQVGTSPGAADIATRVVDGRASVPFSLFYESFSTTAQRTHARVLPVNHCGPAPRASEVYATVGVCRNPHAPRLFGPQVTGGSVTLRWSGTGELEQLLRTYVEVGSSFGASDVAVSPEVSSYGNPQFTTTLPPGRYYARARNVMSGCSDPSNPSNEIVFDVP